MNPREISIQELVDYVVEHHPYAWMWDPDVVLGWVSVFVGEELIECVSTDGKTIDGMIMFRTVMNPEDAKNEYSYDPEGAYIFVEFCCGESDTIRRGLLVSMLQRVGHRPMIAWERYKTLRIHSTARLVRHILTKKEAHHGQQ